MKKNKLKESPPQHEFYKMLKAYLAYDPTVVVGDLYEEITDHIRFDIKIDDPKKMFAFKSLLKLHDEFGGLQYTINLVPANESVAKKAEKIASKTDLGASISKVLKDFFKGNEAFSKVKVVNNPMSQRRDVFCIMKPVIVQYWADNIGSAYGLNTETYEQVTKKIINDDVCVYICSERV